jgi:hypothetical protein
LKNWARKFQQNRRGAPFARDWSIFEVVDLEPRADDQKLLRDASSGAQGFLFDGNLIPECAMYRYWLDTFTFLFVPSKLGHRLQDCSRQRDISDRDGDLTLVPREPKRGKRGNGAEGAGAARLSPPSSPRAPRARKSKIVARGRGGDYCILKIMRYSGADWLAKRRTHHFVNTMKMPENQQQ